MPPVGRLIAWTYSTQAVERTRSAAAMSAGLPLLACADAASTWAASCGPDASPSNGARLRIATSCETAGSAAPPLNQIVGVFQLL